MNLGISEIDDPNFFISSIGMSNAKSELNATITSFFDKIDDDNNSTICKYPARFNWIQKQLNMENLPQVNCTVFKKLYKKVNPKSVTLVFPSAHINSPASMFGHTFLRINSSYNSKLLSYAVNYSANVDTSKTNGISFAIKGLTGGYDGRYSLLPYYEKLKEYRDTEQRDIWEYDLNFTTEETTRMFNHIWELQNATSNYYFLTENCSYNMLWLLEIARPNLYLRDKFLFQVSPIETIHAIESENLIIKKTFRASKRRKILTYNNLIDDNYKQYSLDIVWQKIKISSLIADKTLSTIQKQYILENAMEFLEYFYMRSKITKNDYLNIFHEITTNRAKLGSSKQIKIKRPANPLLAHQSIRIKMGLGSNSNDNNKSVYLGFRSAYHSLDDNSYGLLRGTQIEFLNTLIDIKDNKLSIDKLTLLSISSITQYNLFFKDISWRTKIGWDKKYLYDTSKFNLTAGVGYGLGNESGYIYSFIDPFCYTDKFGIGLSVGLSLDNNKFYNTNLEFTNRIYNDGVSQKLFNLSQGFNISQNNQVEVKYKYIELYSNKHKQIDIFQILYKYYY
jgi:hypothetical protein